MADPKTLFRRHNDGTVTDVFEDDCAWVRDGDIDSVAEIHGDDGLADLRADPDPSHAGMRAYFEQFPDVDGLLYRHADGRTAVVTRGDFGLF